MNTKIYLTTSNGVQNEVDLGEELELNITYQAGDVQKVYSRSTSSSKSVVFPGTIKNNQIFESIYDVTNSSNFNPNRKSYVKVITNGQTIFSGYLKLDRILNTNGVIGYECTMYSDTSNLFEDLSTKKLSELDFSEYAHTYTKENVVGSWDEFIIFNGNKVPTEKGLGYVYPHIDYGIDETNVFTGRILSTEFFRPALYAKTILDKIFSDNNYTYNSNFFNSDYFKSLIVTADGNYGVYDESTIESSQLKASGSLVELYNNYDFNITCSNIVSSNLPMIKATINDDFSSGNFDNGSNFNISNSEYTVPESGLYRVNAATYLNSTVEFLDAVSGFNYSIAYNVKGTFEYYTQIVINRNGVDIELASLQYTNVSEIDASFNMNGSYVNQDRIYTEVEDEIELQVGDKIFVKVGYNYINSRFCHPVAPTNKDIVYRFYQDSPTTLEVGMIKSTFKLNSEQTFVDFLGADSQKDFITSLSKMFNLYFYVDSNDSTKLNIEPRKDFYNGRVFDWTYKLDRNDEIEIVPTNDFDYQKIRFSYKSDSDYWNKDYTDNTDEKIWGEYTYSNIDNDFVKQDSVERVDLIFAPAPPILVKNDLFVSTQRVETHIYKFSEEKGKEYLNTIKPRILFYNGLVDTYTYSISDLYLNNTSSGTSSTYTQYAYAGMLDNPDNPTDSLEFGYPDFYYYERNSVTNSTLYNKFWAVYLDEAFNKDAKMLTGYFKLNEEDIKQVNFRDIIYLDGRYWVINKIVDYDPITTKTTKVELVLLVNYDNTKENITSYQQSINLNQGKYNLGRNIIGNVNKSFVTKTIASNIIKGFSNDINVNSTSNFISGNLNSLGSLSKGSFIIGDNNTFGGGSSNFMVLGEDNTVLKGSSNSLLIGKNNTLSNKMIDSTIIGNDNNITSSTNLFVFGHNNTITGSSNSFIIASGKTINDLRDTVMVPTLLADTIGGITLNDNIIFQNNDVLSGNRWFSFKSGDYLFNSSYNSLLTGSDNSAIIGGQSSQLTNSTNSVILGGSSMSADSLTDTVYVPNLWVDEAIFVNEGGIKTSGFTGTIDLTTATQLIVTNGIITGYI